MCVRNPHPTCNSALGYVEPQVIIDGVDQILPRSEVSFGRLNRGMPEQQLNLLEITAGGRHM
jgi:hypothetical protein